jgi:hypothetical protein
MLIYNVTVKVDEIIAREWLQWMQQEHIPGIMNTGCFVDFKIVRLLDMDDTEGPTYAVQYFADTIGDYQKYLEHHAPRFRKESTDKWGDRFIAFRTLMEVVK